MERATGGRGVSDARQSADRRATRSIFHAERCDRGERGDSNEQRL